MLSYDDSPWLLRLCEFVAVYFAGEIDFRKIDSRSGSLKSSRPVETKKKWQVLNP